jgi:hypothetical protein
MSLGHYQVIVIVSSLRLTHQLRVAGSRETSLFSSLLLIEGGDDG